LSRDDSLAGNNSKKKNEKDAGNDNFEGSDICLSTKLTKRKHLKRRKLEAKIRIVFFLVHQIQNFIKQKLQSTDVASKF
jgi:hypothetical protein